MRSNYLKIASIIGSLDAIAGDLEKEDPLLALRVDQISDRIEKKAFHPGGWLPGRKYRKECYDNSYGTQSKNSFYSCPNCGFNDRSARTCPHCGSSMSRKG